MAVYEKNTVVASHPWAVGNGVKVLYLDHHLEILLRKPGALPGAWPAVSGRDPQSRG